MGSPPFDRGFHMGRRTSPPHSASLRFSSSLSCCGLFLRSRRHSPVSLSSSPTSPAPPRPFTPAPPPGAAGAVIGVALPCAMFWPNAEIIAFPIPIPIKARTLVIGLALIDLVLARIAPDVVAHEAHIGGLIFGFIFFRLQSISRRKPVAQPRQVERVVMVQSASREADPHSAAPMRPIQRPTNDPVAAEVDRVLDKISANGMGSLPPEERRFLDEVSKRKQRDLN